MPPDLAANSGRAARSQALKAPLKPQGLRVFFFEKVLYKVPRFEKNVENAVH